MLKRTVFLLALLLISTWMCAEDLNRMIFDLKESVHDYQMERLQILSEREKEILLFLDAHIPEGKELKQYMYLLEYASDSKKLDLNLKKALEPWYGKKTTEEILKNFSMTDMD
ncbi:MAG: hypothetical protein ACOCWO_01140, partial [Candidatus Muiribacteriaceae bacterium]